MNNENEGGLRLCIIISVLLKVCSHHSGKQGSVFYTSEQHHLSYKANVANVLITNLEAASACGISLLSGFNMRSLCHRTALES